MNALSRLSLRRCGVRLYVQWCVLLCMTLGLLPASRVWAAQPTDGPLVQLDSGMHTARINRIATDASGRYAVTASEDKTALVWDLPSHRRLAVLRPPQDRGEEGKLYAVALSADASLVALAGWTGWDWDGQASIYIFERESQRLLRRIAGVSQRVTHLAFSPDGRWLAASLKHGAGAAPGGLRVFEVASGTERSRDTDYADASYSVEFSPASAEGLRLVTSSDDGWLRLYKLLPSGALQRLVTRKPSAGRWPFAVRFSPDGQRLAVGFADVPAVQVLKATDLTQTLSLDLEGLRNGELSAVDWAADGQSLAAAGTWANAQGLRMSRRWSAQSGAALGDKVLAARTITDIRALPEVAGGGWLFSSADPSWGVLGQDGRLLHRHDAAVLDLREQGQALRLSADGMRVQLGLRPGGGDVHLLDIAERSWLPLASAAPAALADLSPPRQQAPDLVLTQVFNDEHPLLNGKPLALEPFEHSRSLAIAADGASFVLGTDWMLRAFNAKGQPLWAQPMPAAVWAVNLSADGRWVLAVCADGTLRWHRREDGRAALALFLHRDRQRWVMWTPEGFFDAAPQAESLLGYHLNQGREQAGRYISAAQLRDGFYNPALVGQRLLPAGEALLQHATASLGTVEALLAQGQNLPPEVEILTPDIVEGQTEVTLTFRVQDRGGGIGALKFYVDGHPVEGRQSGAIGGQTLTRTFPLAPGQRSIQIAATSRGGVEGLASKPVQATVPGVTRARALHILAVGVESYQDKNLQLRYSVRDAEQVAAEMARRAQPLFTQVMPPRVLKNEQASVAGIQKAFADMRAQMQPQDTLVIFLAGHGEAQIGSYTFLPWDFQRGAAGPAGEGLNEKRIFQMLDQSPTNTLLLIDSCDAGGMVELFEGAFARVGNLKKRALIGASRRGEMAREGYQGHGVFSAALLNVLQRADDGEELSVPGLYEEVRKGVSRIGKELGGGYQQNVKGFIGTADFAIVRR